MIIDWAAQPELLDKLKLQVRIDTDEEDELLKGYVEAALAHVEQHCDRTLVVATPGVDLTPEQMELTPDVWQAVLLLVAHWYANREAVVIGPLATSVPLAFERLLWYRKRF
ncbi:head-tail connector protein [Stutzerimonas stutzeri]|uniref:head-tail connector protein n=1 Tax=Stutzerimonas stutzeri TaxID=316 RepID=UPI001C2E426E|nr:head-tail connector protein [Stutzerimonas stutzeri]